MQSRSVRGSGGPRKISETEPLPAAWSTYSAWKASTAVSDRWVGRRWPWLRFSASPAPAADRDRAHRAQAAPEVGAWSAAARNALVDAVVDPVQGLGYNIFRYNIGGGENPAHEHMARFREMPGFEPTMGTWTWDADANQTAILQRIMERGSGVILE